MMDCRVVRTRLADLIDGHARPAERRALEAHLGQCPDCREEWSAMRAFLADCDECIVCPGPAYSFDALRVRMATVQPLEEIVAFFPKLRINHAIPRYAVAAVMLVLVCASPSTLLRARQCYSALRTPFQTYAVIEKDDNYMDTLMGKMDAQYRREMTQAKSA